MSTNANKWHKRKVAHASPQQRGDRTCPSRVLLTLLGAPQPVHEGALNTPLRHSAMVYGRINEAPKKNYIFQTCFMHYHTQIFIKAMNRRPVLLVYKNLQIKYTFHTSTAEHGAHYGYRVYDCICI